MSTKGLGNLGLSGNADLKDDEDVLIPDEEEKDDISKEKFTNSKLSLDVAEAGKKVDELFAEEKEVSLFDTGKDGEMPSSELQEDNLKKNGDGTDIIQTTTPTLFEAKIDHLIGGNDTQLEEPESYGTPPTNSTPLVSIGNLTPEESPPANIEDGEIAEEGNKTTLDLQEETANKEDSTSIIQTKTTEEVDQQVLSSTTPVEPKNVHFDDIQHDTGEVEFYGTPPTNAFRVDNLTPEKTTTAKNDGVDEEVTLGEEFPTELQESKKEDGALQQTDADRQTPSSFAPMEAGNGHNNDIQLNPLEEESYGTPLTNVHPELKETNTSPLVNPTPEVEQPTWFQEKEKFLNATIEERKKRGKFTELSSILTWPEYFNENLNVGTDVAVAENSDICPKVSIWRGDITTLLIDGIVNAANERLLGGAGVDGAIHSAAGPYLKKECYQFGGRSAGESVITGGYNLPAKYVIHTVGPRGEIREKLEKCYLSSLELLIGENQRSIAFPCISTGIFGYPNDNAAEVVLQTIRDWLEKNHDKVDRVILCLFLKKDVEIYEKKMQQHFPMMGGRTKSNAEEEQPEFKAEEKQQGFPNDVASGNTSIPGESEHSDISTSGPYPERKCRTDTIEYEENETEFLIPTAPNGSFNWWRLLLPCCFKPKTL